MSFVKSFDLFHSCKPFVKDERYMCVCKTFSHECNVYTKLKHVAKVSIFFKHNALFSGLYICIICDMTRYL